MWDIYNSTEPGLLNEFVTAYITCKHIYGSYILVSLTIVIELTSTYSILRGLTFEYSISIISSRKKFLKNLINCIHNISFHSYLGKKLEENGGNDRSNCKS